MFYNRRDYVTEPRAPVIVGGAVTFDPAVLTAVVLSTDKLTATCNAASPSGFARSTTSHSSGLFYVEFTFTNDAGGITAGVGVVDSAFIPGSGFVGGDTHGTAYYNAGTRYFNGSEIGGMASITYTTVDIIPMCIDLNNRKNWWAKNGSIFSPPGLTGDPVTNVGGGDLSALATNVYLAVDFEGAVGSAFRLNLGPSFAFTPPSGFGMWT